MEKRRTVGGGCLENRVVLLLVCGDGDALFGAKTVIVRVIQMAITV